MTYARHATHHVTEQRIQPANALVTTKIQLRLDRRSTNIDRAVRPFDDLYYDRIYGAIEIRLLLLFVSAQGISDTVGEETRN